MSSTQAMTLGNFSVRLAVKDLEVSRAFYRKLGFQAIAGDPTQNWLILQNDNATIGLFQGMFERNLLTFNPGWDRAGNTLAEYTGVRELQRRLKRAGIEPVTAADESTTGPASSAGMHSIDTPDVAALPTVWTFFYGSYMNLDVLKEVDLIPGRVEVARLNGFDILIRPLANLVRSDQP